MTTFNSEVILGTISYLGPATRHRDARIDMHKMQVDWLGEITGRMIAEGKGQPLPYFRVEQCWDQQLRTNLEPSFPVTSINLTMPVPPGAARNVLLYELYNSDASWLICMDDDHMMFDHYNCHELFWDLGSPAGIKLAKDRCLVVPVPTYWEGYKQQVADWGKAETYWFLKRARIWGYLPIVAIPNLVKFGYDPIWFEAGWNSKAPEDLKFEIDWVAKGGSLFQCYMWPARSCGDMTKSSVFKSDDERLDRVKYIHSDWAPSYLKSIFPRNPALWTESGFKQRKNPVKFREMPRSFSYTLLPSDLPNEEEKKRHVRRKKS